MSTDTEEVNYPPVQFSFFINGDQLVYRAPDGQGLENVAKSVAERADGIITAVSDVKQIAVAKGVFTGGPKNATTPQAVAGPPSGAAPSCAHGALKDLGGKGYKHRWYCPAPRGQQQCPPQD